MTKIVTRKEAIEIGLKQYFTGKPCIRGHISTRNTAAGNCHKCWCEDNVKYKDPSYTKKEIQINKKISMPVTNFIEQAHKKHNNKYDYSKVTQETLKRTGYSKITIICPKHGEFLQRMADHLKGHGCQKCKNISVSNKALTWLDYIQETKNIIIQHAGNGGEYLIPGTKYSVDGYCSETNTVYEFDGDAFHGNPNRYQPDDNCHPFDKQLMAKQLLDRTLMKHAKLKELGFNVVSIWESDFDLLNIPIKVYDDLPVMSRKDDTYPQQLLDIGLRLLESYKGAKKFHKMECVECGFQDKFTPLAKIQVNKQRGSIGCPNCNRKKKAAKFKERGDYVDRLLELNYKVYDYINAKTPVLLECLICGKQKTVVPGPVIQRNKPCCEK
ncbi:MAG: hypothetical protein ACXW2E_02015 [Nitrososphaeraceae archaeon]